MVKSEIYESSDDTDAWSDAVQNTEQFEHLREALRPLDGAGRALTLFAKDKRMASTVAARLVLLLLGSSEEYLKGAGETIPFQQVLVDFLTCGKLSVLSEALGYRQDRLVTVGMLVGKQQHPDFMLVSSYNPESRKEGIISIEAIREAKSFCYSTPVLGKRKILLINDASYLNANASDALLKTVEEPTQHLSIVMIASSPLKATLHSRCQNIRLPSIPYRIFAQQYADEDRAYRDMLYNCSDGDAYTLSLLSKPVLKSFFHLLLRDSRNQHELLNRSKSVLEDIPDGFRYISKALLWFAYQSGIERAALSDNPRSFKDLRTRMSNFNRLSELLYRAEHQHLDKDKVLVAALHLISLT